MKLDKWDFIIGLIMASWVIFQILRLLVLYPPFDAEGVEPFLLVYVIVPFLSWCIGVLFLLGSAIVLLVRAFQASLLWGLAVLFIPFAALVFLFKHWHQSWRPFLTSILGVALIVIAFAEATWGY